MPNEYNGPNRDDPPSQRKRTPHNPSVHDAMKIFSAQFLSAKAAGDELGLSENTMRKYCQDGCFTNTQRFGGEWVISRFDIEWWRQNRQGKSGRPVSE